MGIDYKCLVAGFALIVAAFAAFNGALSLNSDSDQVYLRGADGRVFFWLVNSDGVEKTVALSADLGELNGFFEESGFALAGSGSKGTWLHFSAPQCFRGTQRVPVTAEVCDLQGSCEEVSKTVFVQVTPPAGCVDYNGVFVPSGSPFEPAVAYGGGSLAFSTLAYSSYFDPTDFSVEVRGSVLCPQARPGDVVQEKFSILNRGAASSFDLRVIDSEDGVGGSVSPSKIALRRGEAAEVSVLVSPQWIPGGRKYLSLQVLRQGLILAEKPVCVDVQDVVEAAVRMPAQVSGRQCEEIKFQGIIENTGNVENSFQLFVPDNAVAAPDYLTVQPSGQEVFTVSIPANSLQEGKRVLCSSVCQLLLNVIIK